MPNQGSPPRKLAPPREMLRPFLTASLAYLLVAALIGLALAIAWLAGAEPPAGLRLAHVHLALLGAASQAMLGAMPFFAIALLAALPPEPGVVRLQWWSANLGTIALTLGFAIGWPLLALGGGIVVLIAAVIAGWTVFRMLRGSMVGRRIDIDYYLTAFLYGLVGIILGLVLVTGLADASLPRVGLRLAHVHTTAVGWVSLTIVGTMHSFFPTVLGTRPGSARVFAFTFWLLVGGGAALALGLVWLVPLGFLGGLAIAIAALLYCGEVVRVRHAHVGPLDLAGAHLFAAALYFGVVCLAGLLLVLWRADALPIDGRWLVAYAHLAFVGWVIQTLVGAMVYLLPVAVGPSQRRANPNSTSPSWPSYADLRTVMESNASLQFWLLNGGLWLFILALLVAPVFPLWMPFFALGGLAMLLAFVVFASKAAKIWTALHRRR